MQASPAVQAMMPPDLEPEAVPREEVWQHYRVLAAGSVQATRLLIEDLAAILTGQRDGDLDVVLQHVEALGVVHQSLAAAVSGLDAVRSTHGVA